MRDAYKDERVNSTEKPHQYDMFEPFCHDGLSKPALNEGARDGLADNKPLYRGSYDRRN